MSPGYQVTIRPYSSQDHATVCKLFYAGMVENWVPAYRRIVTGSAPLPAILQLVIMVFLYISSSSIFWFLLLECMVQAVFILVVFYLYWAYASEHLASDMKDKELSFWTGRGDDTGFFVASIGKEVVGTISYVKQSKDHLEINRVSTDNQYRKAGIASQLVARVEAVARELKCEEIVAETSVAQEAAIVFYHKNGWTEQSRTSYPGNFVHGIELVKFCKSVH